MKVCGKCKASPAHGANYYCKPCRKEYDAAWRIKHRDKIREGNAKYHAANREEIRQRKRTHYYANLERYKENSRRWREANPERNAQSKKNWKIANAARIRDWDRKWKYGLEIGEFDRMLHAQSNACLICKRVTRLCVDHDHETGEVRGLICSVCNKALGMFGDSEEGLQAALDYIKRPRLRLAI